MQSVTNHNLSFCRRLAAVLAVMLAFSGWAQNQPTNKVVYRKIATTNTAEITGPHFTRARELYSKGPSKAKEVIAELELELKDNPENTKAFLLKATTEMGTEQFDAALTTLDQLDKVTAKKKIINPSAIYLRARTLFFKGDYEKAKKTLAPYSGFFQGDPANQAQYKKLMGDIEAKLEKPPQK